MTITLEDNTTKITLALRNASLDEVDSVIERLHQYRERLAAQVDIEAEQEQLTNQILEASKKLGGSANIRIEIKKAPYNRAPKYQFKDEKGVYKTWAGTGKLPLALKKKITVNGEVDKSRLEKFLIIQDENARYLFKDESNGKIRTWSGKGTTPGALQTLLEKGNRLEDFLIYKDDELQYMYKDESDGQLKTWSGKGRKPQALQLLLDKGYKLENFKVKK